MQPTHKKHGTDYLELVNKLKDFARPILLRDELGWENLLKDPHRQQLSKPIPVNVLPGNKFFAIRHDVDEATLTPAMLLADFENKNHIRATYFLHQNRAYWWGETFTDQCNQLQDMGHEVGWHNDALARWIEEKHSKQLPHYIINPLEWLRGQGIHVLGTSCHGSKITNDLALHNYHIWLDCPYPIIPLENVFNERIITHKATLSTYGLTYEAYFLRRDVYLSDNHGDWTGGLGDQVMPFEDNYPVDPFELIQSFKAMEDGGFMQILIHPQHWNLF